jgi:hypothetical protein
VHSAFNHTRAKLPQQAAQRRQIFNPQLDLSLVPHFFLNRPAPYAFRRRRLPLLYRTNTIHFARPPDLAARTEHNDQ